MQGHSCDVCDSAHISESLWSPHFIIFFLAVLCIPGFHMFLTVSFSFLLSVSAWLDYLLTVVMPTPKLENWSREDFSFFSPPFFFCVKYSLHSYQAAWTEYLSMVNSSVTLVWTLKFLNICFCSVQTLNIPSLILAACLHLKIRKIKKISEVEREFYRQVVAFFLFKLNCKHISNTIHTSNL